MKSFIAALRNLVLPFGRTSGQRIILDGDGGTIRIYDATNTLIAELSPSVEGGGLWTRGVQTIPLTAFIGGGKAQFDTLADGVIDTPAIVLLDTNGTSYVSLIQSSGKRLQGDQEGRIILQSTGPGRGRVFVTPSGTAKPAGYPLQGADLEVYGAIDAHGIIRSYDRIECNGSANFTGFLTLGADANIAGSISSGENITATGHVSAGNSQFVTWDPTPEGAGTATWSTKSGFGVKFGKLWWVNMYLDSSAAGSGTAAVTLQLPFTPDRTSRQMLPVYASHGSVFVTGSANVFVTGTFAGIDNLRLQDGGAASDVKTLTGAQITSNDFYTITGWMREA